MTKAEWFARYSECHRNPRNILIHKFCVPAIVYTQTGMLWLLGSPGFWPAQWPAFYSCFELALALLFYMQWRDWRLLGWIVLLFVVPNLALWWSLPHGMIAPLAFGGFIVAWIGQFLGHVIEGKKPSFFEDLQFLLIGPAWVLTGRSGVSF